MRATPRQRERGVGAGEWERAWRISAATGRLGLLEPAHAAALRLGGRGLALLLGAGFTLVPIALVLRPAAPLLAGG